MFKRILVPLDGSDRAEQALPLAAHLARVAGGTIVLLQVADTLNRVGAYSGGATVFLQDLVEKDLLNATAYLSRIATSGELKGIETNIAVFSGLPATHILDVAYEQDIDLIVMCSHGYTGFKRWALGSVAQKVVRQSTVPILLVREQNTQLREKLAHSMRVQVALDGSLLAESMLQPAIDLSAALSAPLPGALHLVRVLPFSSDFDYGQDDAVAKARRQDVQEAQIYLRELQKRLLEENPDFYIMTSLAMSMDIAQTLIDIAETGKGEGLSEITGCSDIIALATHGRSGPARWVLGSVTERILGATSLPLLIVRPQQANESGGQQETKVS
ncbi:MAG TPA: universal stress protein [Ktedonobacteraceae bacterium]|nr:universal stress protein [Ktedonobacteraceae bacterium]